MNTGCAHGDAALARLQMPQVRLGWPALTGLLMFCVLMSSTVLHAGPPFLTDDPEPVDYHHSELYVASAYQLTADGSSATAPQIEGNYGAAPNLQLHLIAPMSLDAPRDGRMEYGYGDTELGFKYRFLQESGHVPMVGIFPLVELPTGSASHGLGNGRVQLYMPVWIQKSFADGTWTTYGGGGYWINNATGAKNHWFVGWELQRQLTDSLALGGEIFYQTSDAEGAGPHTGFNLGFILDLTEHHHILFSAGRDLIGDTRFMCYAAYQFTS
jgi:hypothetical protein